MTGQERETLCRIAGRFLARETKWTKTAGEVRFIKDRGGDKNEWGWGSPGPTEREIGIDFKFNPKNLKPLAKALRSTLSAMGYALSAYDTFTRLKSAVISPDGAFGGKGYIQKISDMRRQFMNSVEALSALSDTLYDEMHAAHWDPAQQEQSSREREEVRNIMQDVEEIKDDPEEWAEEAEEELDDADGDSETESPAKKKSRKQAMKQLRKAGGVCSDISTLYVVANPNGARAAARILAYLQYCGSVGHSCSLKDEADGYIGGFDGDGSDRIMVVSLDGDPVDKWAAMSTKSAVRVAARYLEGLK